MTPAQVIYFCDVAAIREHNEYAQQAALHGHKVKMKSYETLRMRDMINHEKLSDADHDKIKADVLSILAEGAND